MKFLAVLLTCLLAASLLVVFVAGEEVAEEAASSSSESVSSSSEEAIAESSSGSEEIASSSGELDAVSSSSGDVAVDSGSGEATESGSGAVEESSGDVDEAVPVVEFKDVDEDELEGTVTFTTKYSKVMEADDISTIRQTIARLLQEELARMEQLEHEKDAHHRRRRSTATAAGDEYEVTIIAPTPRFSPDDAEQLEIVLFARGPDGVVPQETILAAMNNLAESGALAQHNMPMTSVHSGYPEDLDDLVLPAARTSGDRGMWHEHLGLFIAIIGLAVVCLIILIIGFACLKCRSKRGSWTRTDDSTPITMEDGKGYQYELNSPLPDEEITKGEAPMVESANGAEPAWSNKNWLMPMDDETPSAPSTDNTKF